MQLKVKKTHPDAYPLKYATSGSAAFDISSIEQVEIKSGETKLVDTGWSFEIPEGYELEIRPRSGLSLNSKIRLSNSPGTIDSDFRGTVKFIVDLLMTRFPETYTITKGQRLGQALLKKVEQAEIVEVEELSDTERGSKGMGSSGK